MIDRSKLEERGEYKNVDAGTFVYHGFGMGYYHSTDGIQYWCITTEAYQMAAEDGTSLIYRDVLDRSAIVCVMD